MIINDSRTTKTRKGNSRYATVSWIMIVVAVLLLLSFTIIGKNETHFSEEKDDLSLGLLDCKSDNPTNPFFNSKNAKEPYHEVKITFKSGKPDKLTYNYYGSYANEAVADTARSEMHAQYNKYMSSSDLNPESLFPTFDYYGSDVKIGLYASLKDTLDLATARIFFLNPEEYNKLDSATSDNLKEIYINKGFSCNSK